jgi:hypothetical protein
MDTLWGNGKATHPLCAREASKFANRLRSAQWLGGLGESFRDCQCQRRKARALCPVGWRCSVGRRSGRRHPTRRLPVPPNSVGDVATVPIRKWAFCFAVRKGWALSLTHSIVELSLIKILLGRSRMSFINSHPLLSLQGYAPPSLLYPPTLT